MKFVDVLNHSDSFLFMARCFSKTNFSPSLPYLWLWRAGSSLFDRTGTWREVGTRELVGIVFTISELRVEAVLVLRRTITSFRLVCDSLKRIGMRLLVGLELIGALLD